MSEKKKTGSSSDFAPTVNMDEVDKKIFAAMSGEAEKIKKSPKRFDIEAGHFINEPPASDEI